MNDDIVNTKHQKRRKWVRALKGVIVIIALIALFFVLMSVFSTEQRVHSLNAFLANGYWYFLLFRLAIYGIVIVVCLKVKPKIKPTPYYKKFVRTGYLCMAFVLFNEVMLYIRLMGY